MAVSEEELGAEPKPTNSVHYLAKTVLKGSAILHVAHGRIRSPTTFDIVLGKVRYFCFLLEGLFVFFVLDFVAFLFKRPFRMSVHENSNWCMSYCEPKPSRRVVGLASEWWTFLRVSLVADAYVCLLDGGRVLGNSVDDERCYAIVCCFRDSRRLSQTVIQGSLIYNSLEPVRTMTREACGEQIFTKGFISMFHLKIMLWIRLQLPIAYFEQCSLWSPCISCVNFCTTYS